MSTHAERMLTKIEALLEGTADPSVKSIEINGKRLDRHSPLELLEIRSRYKAEVATETAAAAITAGSTGTGKIRVRL